MQLQGIIPRGMPLLGASDLVLRTQGGSKPAAWHRFAIKGNGRRPLLAFPDIWRR
jgi:hypothetical protein